MINKKYVCNVCKKSFDTPFFYEERHGLDCPPYERVAVCPGCKSNDYFVVDTFIEKSEIVDRLLMCLSKLNCFSEGMSDFFGVDCKNSDFCDGISILQEMITDLFPYISVDTERQLLFVKNEKDVDMILKSLKGVL